jgi:predicted nucleic acid-binding protein
LIVIDASALLELLLRTARADRVASRALAPEERLHAPHLLDVEIAQALRRLDHSALVVDRHGHYDLLPRIWQLRESITAYDAAYVALAEVLDAPLLTCDAKLGNSHGHRARLELLE